MAATIQASDVNDVNHSLTFDRKPDKCPLCHHAVDPRQMPGATVIGTEVNLRGAILELVFQCTRRECRHFLVGRYERRRFDGPTAVGDFFLFETAPTIVVEPTLPSEISDVSASFQKVYCQASTAEALKLDQIAGVGFRKALEFLVKDYCIAQNPPDSDRIKKEALGATIANRVTDANIKECARRAAWLGNDETHYVRLWEGKDISDLKTLIELTMGWIRNAVLTKKYLDSMAEGRKP